MTEPFRLDRRRFLSQTATGLALGLVGRLAPLGRASDRSAGANGRLRVAIAGTNSRGLAHIQCFGTIKNVEIAYICDVDDRAIAKGLAETAKWQPVAPKGVRDFRRALEDPTVDALAIATPDHWHAPMALLALAAGKHVFVEKPCSQNPHEGELLVAAACKSDRLVQMGNQRRSFAVMREAIASIHAGAIGRPYFARAWYTNSRGSIGRGRPAPVPDWLDYDLWQGPAPRRPFTSNLIHYNWHWFWHWGTGEALNNGTHEVDVGRWALGVDHPLKVASLGGRYHFQDDWETPDTQTINWEFPGGKSMAWEGRSCNAFPVEGRARGTMVHGTEGSALLDGTEYSFFDRKNKIVHEVKGGAPVDATNTVSSTGIAYDAEHFQNFVDAIRDGVPLNSPVSDANTSVHLLHLGNISQRVGRELHCDPATGRIQGDVEAMKLWRRDYAPGWEPVA
jgi:predicted dehydrogenase